MDSDKCWFRLSFLKGCILGRKGLKGTQAQLLDFKLMTMLESFLVSRSKQADSKIKPFGGIQQ